jgi:two-component system, NtrC family, response regulator HydG
MQKKVGKILIVDDNEGVLKSMRYALKFEFERADGIKSPNQIASILREQSYDVILLDMNFQAGKNTGNEGLYWLKEILTIDPDMAVVMITAYGDVELAVKAIRLGAIDFVLKPWNLEKLLSTIHAGIKYRQSRKEVNQLKQKQKILSEDVGMPYQTILGESPAMLQLFQTIEKVAATDANVLILGENGTGKELVAREIHRRSLRNKEIFLGVDLASLSESIFESELFGHVKGAFTDAKEDRAGRFESANGGTLFLDEIGNLNMSLQGKILTSLQNRTVSRIGSNRLINLDIRLISATNKDLKHMVSEGLFREDLLYRLNTIQIIIPPLRERKEDILRLAEHFLKIYNRKYNKPDIKLTASAVEKLNHYHWPGNVRELQHAMERALILSENANLKDTDFLFESPKQEIQASNTLNLEEVEKSTVEKALMLSRGNLTLAAKELGITRKTLYSKIQKYDL